MTKQLSSTIKIAPELFNFISDVCNNNAEQAIETIEKFAEIVRQLRTENAALLKKRNELQEQINEFFIAGQGQEINIEQVVSKFEQIGFIENAASNKQAAKIIAHDLPAEITPLAGPQLVVPADKVNMVLGAANSRWGSIYDALYTSNIIDAEIKNEAQRRNTVVKYCNDFLDKIVQFTDGASWNDIAFFILDQNVKGDSSDITSFAATMLKAISKTGQVINLMPQSLHKFLGYNIDGQGVLSDFILENNGLKIEIILQPAIDDNIEIQKLAAIKDVKLESALTYIIDLEDASISAPGNKYESYRIIKGIHDGNLVCEVRGALRQMASNSSYVDAKTGQKKNLPRTALPLVREVGPHLMADGEIIIIDEQKVPEKFLDCFITSLIGMRFHVAPKMHGSLEVDFNVRLWQAINEAQELPQNSNKIGVMNEELRTNAQLQNSIAKAKDIIFFTNTGFLDYTGSFIDTMMHAGPIVPYRVLAQAQYKIQYEKHNVNISLAACVPQIGAGMWAAIKDMAGLLKSKEAQVQGLTDTGWSPSPMAATIHAIAFHIFGNVRTMQEQYSHNIQHVNIESLFVFPRLDTASLTDDEKIRNLDFATHGLLAYAEPWVRRGIGCSGVKDLSGEPLMEDRATARIKAAFIRNWLLHKIVTKNQVEDSILRMAQFVDEQNVDTPDYESILSRECSNINAENPAIFPTVSYVITAVHQVIFNPSYRKDSYVEPYFYAAYKQLHAAAAGRR